MQQDDGLQSLFWLIASLAKTYWPLRLPLRIKNNLKNLPKFIQRKSEKHKTVAQFALTDIPEIKARMKTCILGARGRQMPRRWHPLLLPACWAFSNQWMIKMISITRELIPFGMGTFADFVPVGTEPFSESLCNLVRVSGQFKRNQRNN